MFGSIVCLKYSGFRGQVWSLKTGGGRTSQILGLLGSFWKACISVM